jgi:hypothetical protein
MGIFSSLLDLYENTRKTKTKIESDKPKERNYNFNGGFSGIKKEDLNMNNKSRQTKPKKEVEEREDR